MKAMVLGMVLGRGLGRRRGRCGRGTALVSLDGLDELTFTHGVSEP